MIHIAALKSDLKSAKYHLEKGQELFDKYICDGKINKRWEMDINLTKAIVRVYHRNGEFEKPKQIMTDLIANNRFPGIELMSYYLQGVCEGGQGKVFLEAMLEFELYGFVYDQELCRDAMKLWWKVKDYRRFKNTWDLCINLGYKPGLECTDLMLKVYANSHSPEDMQKFYDVQVRAEVEMTRDMHEIMMYDYLRRGFPGSAREVASKMTAMGAPPTQTQLEEIASGYSAKGGGSQILSLIKKEVNHDESNYTVTANLLAILVEGFANSDDPKKATAARTAWKKYGATVVFDLASATRAILAFNGLREPDISIGIYDRIRQDYQIKPTDGDDLFYAVTMAPPSHFTHLTQRLKVFEHMKEYRIAGTLRVFCAAMCLCADHASISGALFVMKKFVVDYYGLPFFSRLCVEFLTIVVRYDSGEYGQLARAWINRIVPKQMETQPFFPNLREELGNQSDLEARLNQVISIPQSLSFGKFVASLEPEKFVTPDGENDVYAELFSGGEVDLEDILIHKYGKDIDSVHAALHDKDYEIIQEATARIERKRALLRSESIGKE